jgi:cellulose 1,4-beta-cellobiosidase
MGNTSFFGPGKTIDTRQKFTVVTQFPAGAIKRYFIQNGKVFANPASDVAGVSGNQITDTFCNAQKAAFGDTTSFQNKGGLTQMQKAFAQPMVLVLSLWDDYAVDMLWLDSTYPPNKATTAPGVARGTCATTSGVPADVESQQAAAQVVYSNIRFGPIGSTTPGTTLTGMSSHFPS